MVGPNEKQQLLFRIRSHHFKLIITLPPADNLINGESLLQYLHQQPVRYELPSCIVNLTKCSVLCFVWWESGQKGIQAQKDKNSPPSAATLLGRAVQTWMGSRPCIQTGRSGRLGRTQTWCGPFFAPSWWWWRRVSGKRCPGSSLPSVSVGSKVQGHTNYNEIVHSVVLQKCSYTFHNLTTVAQFLFYTICYWLHFVLSLWFYSNEFVETEYGKKITSWHFLITTV